MGRVFLGVAQIIELQLQKADGLEALQLGRAIGTREVLADVWQGLVCVAARLGGASRS